MHAPLTLGTSELNHGSGSLGSSDTTTKGMSLHRSGWSRATTESFLKVMASHSASGVPASSNDCQLHPCLGQLMHAGRRLQVPAGGPAGARGAALPISFGL